MARRLARLDRAGQLDGSAKQQKLFGQRRLAGIRVRNDGKGAAAGNFIGQLSHIGRKGKKHCIIPARPPTPPKNALSGPRRPWSAKKCAIVRTWRYAVTGDNKPP